MSDEQNMPQPPVGPTDSGPAAESLPSLGDLIDKSAARLGPAHTDTPAAFGISTPAPFEATPMLPDDRPPLVVVDEQAAATHDEYAAPTPANTGGGCANTISMTGVFTVGFLVLVIGGSLLLANTPNDVPLTLFTPTARVTVEPSPTISPTSTPQPVIVQTARFGASRRNYVPDARALVWTVIDDEPVLVAAEGQTITFLDITQPLINIPPATYTAVSFSPDGQFLALGTDSGDLYLRRIGGPTWRRRNAQSDAIGSIIWSPDNTQFLVTNAAANQTAMWDIGLVEALQTFDGATFAVWNTSGSMALVGYNRNRLTLWSTDGTTRTRLILRNRTITHSSASPATFMVALVAEDEPEIIQQRSPFDSAETQITAQGEVTSVAWSPDGTVLAFGDDRGLVLWRRDTQSVAAVITIPGSDPVLQLTWSADSKHLGAVVGSRVYTWMALELDA
jgi:hypothetical protein